MYTYIHTYIHAGPLSAEDVSTQSAEVKARMIDAALKEDGILPSTYVSMPENPRTMAGGRGDDVEVGTAIYKVCMHVCV